VSCMQQRSGSMEACKGEKPLQGLLSETSTGTTRGKFHDRSPCCGPLHLPKRQSRAPGFLPGDETLSPLAQLSQLSFLSHHSRSQILKEPPRAEWNQPSKTFDSSTDSQEKELRYGGQARSSSCSLPATTRLRDEHGRSIFSHTALSPGFGRTDLSPDTCSSDSPSRSPRFNERSRQGSERVLRKPRVPASEVRPKVQRTIVTWPVTGATRSYSGSKAAGDLGAVLAARLSQAATPSAQLSSDPASSVVASPNRARQLPSWRR